MKLLSILDSATDQEFTTHPKHYYVWLIQMLPLISCQFRYGSATLTNNVKTHVFFQILHGVWVCCGQKEINPLEDFTWLVVVIQNGFRHDLQISLALTHVGWYLHNCLIYPPLNLFTPSQVIIQLSVIIFSSWRWFLKFDEWIWLPISVFKSIVYRVARIVWQNVIVVLSMQVLGLPCTDYLSIQDSLHIFYLLKSIMFYIQLSNGRQISWVRTESVLFVSLQELLLLMYFNVKQNNQKACQSIILVLENRVL